MNTVMYAVYSSRSRGCPMVIFKIKWHAQSWIASQHPNDKYASKYWIQRVQIRDDKKELSYVINEHVGYKTIFTRKVALMTQREELEKLYNESVMMGRLRTGSPINHMVDGALALLQQAEFKNSAIEIEQLLSDTVNKFADEILHKYKEIWGDEDEYGLMAAIEQVRKDWS